MKKLLSDLGPTKWLFVALLFGLLVRIFYLLEYKQYIIFFSSPTGESKTYLDLSAKMIYFDLFDKKFLFYSPVYLLLISAFRLLWNSYRYIYLIQTLLGVINIYFAYAVTKQLFDEKKGAIACWVVALSPVFLFYESKINPVTVAITTLLIIILLVIKIIRTNDFISYGLLGFFCAILSYLYAQYLIFLAIGLLILVVLKISFIIKNRWRLVFSIITFIICAIPFVVWRQMISDRFVPFNKGSGYHFFLNSSYPSVKDYSTNEIARISPNPYDSALKTAETKTQRLFQYEELDKYYFKERLIRIKQDPKSYFRILAFQLKKLFEFSENTQEKSYLYESNYCQAALLPFIPSFLILTLGVIFFFVGKLDRGFKLFFGLLILTSIMSFFILSSFSHYKALILIAMVPFSANGIYCLFDNLKTSSYRRYLSISAILFIILIIILSQKVRLDEKKEPLLSYNFAQANENRGLYQTAIFHYYDVLRLYPNNLVVINNASITAIKGNLFDDAEKLLKMGLHIYANSADLHSNLGFTYMNMHKSSLAKQEFKKALEINKHHEHALLNIGVLLKMEGSYDESLKYFKIIPRWASTYANGLQNIAEIYLIKKDYETAYLYYSDLQKLFGKDLFINWKLKEIEKQRQRQLYYKKRKAS